MSQNKQSSDNKNAIQNEIYAGKQVEWYSIITNAAVNSMMERDKQLLYLSSAALGFLSLLIEKVTSLSAFLLLTSSGIAYLLCIILLLHIFNKNADLMDDLLLEKNCDRLTIYMKKVDTIIYLLFIYGVASTFILSMNSINFKIIIGN